MLIANPTRKKLASAARKDTAAKLSCEGRMALDLRRTFKRMGSDFDVLFSHTGQTLNVGQYKSELEGNLKDHYRRTSEYFKTAIRDSMTDAMATHYKTPAIQKEIDHAIFQYSSQRAQAQAKLILDTTHERMINALMSAHIEAAKIGQNADRNFIGDYMRKWFNAAAAGRAATIATTEVNTTAEFSKSAEATVINQHAPKKATFVLYDVKARVVIARDATMEKTWVAQLDEKTRPAHAEADFQTVPVNDFFTVDGESLMFPSDDENGASPENIINCWCTAVYHVGDNFFGEERPSEDEGGE